MKKFLLTAVFALIAALVVAQERIAVFPFEDMDNVLTRTETIMFYREFSNEFANQARGRFYVVPRQEVDKLISTEMDFQLSVFSAQEKTAEMMRVQNATQILSGLIGRVDNNIRITVSLYTYPELVILPGGNSLSVANTSELFRRIPELVRNMQNAIAEGDTEQSIPEWLEYKIIDDRTITITEYNGNAAVLNIPSIINGLPVTSIEYLDDGGSYHRGAFQNCRSLTTVNIPSSVTSIDWGTFDGCINLTRINVDARNPVYASVNGALVEKNNQNSDIYLEGSTYIIPSSVTDIEGNWFAHDESITSITVDNRNPVYASVDGVLFDKNIRTIIAYPAGRTATTYTIPSSVTSIGEYAFYGCEKLTSITIPSSVTSIDDAFIFCNSLTSITVDNRNSVYASVDGVLFDKNIRTLILYPEGKNQRTYVIPSSVTSIGSGAFRDCTNLTSVTIPSSVTSIGSWAFRDCTSLTSVTIPSSVRSIGDYAFAGCSSLTSITIPSSLTSTGNWVFAGCRSLTSVTIPSSVRSIGEGTFSDCSSLTSITIPSSVTSIETYAFYGCEKLTSITIPSSVTDIGYAFSGCSSLTSITVDNRNPVYASVDGVLFDKNIRTLILYPENKRGSYVIPSSVTTIESGFSYHKYLTSITISSSITTIGHGEFRQCESLISVTIPSSVTEIGGYAFYGCSNLTNVNIPASVTSIGGNAFENCTSLTSVNIPYLVTKIETYTFFNCNSLTSINVDARNTEYSSIDGVLFDKNKEVLIQYPESKNERTYIIPSSVKTIASGAFIRCSNLTSITIPSSVTAIGGSAFAGCSSLTSITIPSSVRTIYYYFSDMFEDCSSLTSITVDNRNPYYASVDGVLFDKSMQTLIKYPQGKYQRTYIIPSSVTDIYGDAFNGCSSLTSITLPSSVTSIGYNAFWNCSSLTSINVDNRNLAFASIDGVLYDKNIRVLIKYPGGKNQRTYNIPSTVTKMEEHAFDGCRNLSSITVDNRNPVYASVDGVLYDKNILLLIKYPEGKNQRTYLIPSSVTSIEPRAFVYCSSLTSMNIPSSVSFIGDYAFAGCDNLTNVTLSGNPQLGIDDFGLFKMFVFPETTRITYSDAPEVRNYYFTGGDR